MDVILGENMKKIIYSLIVAKLSFAITPTREQEEFFKAVKEADVHAMRSLLENPTVDVNFPSRRGDSALHIAVRDINPLSEEIVSTLLKAGAKVNLTNP